MRHAEATGLWRHRSARPLFGRERLVLQLQERGLLTTYQAGQIDTQWVTRWRDARTSDLPTPLGGSATYVREAA